MDNKKLFLLLVALFAFLNFSHSVLKEAAFSPFNDFGNYWLNARLLTEGYNAWDDAPVVRARRQELAVTYQVCLSDAPLHSPGFFVFFRPFSGFPYRSSALLWLAAGIAALAAALAVFLRCFGLYKPREHLLSVFFLVFSFWPLIEQIHDGQPNFFILLLVCLVLCALKKERYFLAGFIFGITAQFREYIGIAALFFLVTRNWRALAGFLAGVVSLKLCAVLMYGWQVEPAYWARMLAMFGRSVYPFPGNLSFPATVWRVIAPVIGSGGAFCAGAVCVFALTFFAWARGVGKKDSVAGFLLFVILAVLVSPWVHESHFTMLLPAVVLVWPIAGGGIVRVAGLFIAAYLLMGLKYSLNSFPAFHAGLPALVSTGKLMGVILLFIVWWVLAGKERIDA